MERSFYPDSIYDMDYVARCCGCGMIFEIESVGDMKPRKSPLIYGGNPTLSGIEIEDNIIVKHPVIDKFDLYSCMTSDQKCVNCKQKFDNPAMSVYTFIRLD